VVDWSQEPGYRVRLSGAVQEHFDDAELALERGISAGDPSLRHLAPVPAFAKDR
jgi:hypothetical protein